jgi:hypothetical protein
VSRSGLLFRLLADTFFALLYPTVWLFLLIGFMGTLPVFVVRKQFLSSQSPFLSPSMHAVLIFVNSNAART